MTKKRVVITGMSILTRLGDTLESFYENLLAGKSGITHWKCVDTSGIYSKIGGDLSDYNVEARLEVLAERTPKEIFKRLRKIIRKAPFATRMSLLSAVDAYLHAGLPGKHDPVRTAVILGGHNLNKLYEHHNYLQFMKEPDYVDASAPFLSLDTDHAGSVSEVLECKGAMYTLGGACASANIGLRNALMEIKYQDHDIALVVGATLEYAPMDLHAMALMGAIAFKSFNEAPEKASRPYDLDREGFLPAHGSATLVVEELEHAKRRGAKIYAEILGVSAMSDACHLPSPSQEGQARTLRHLLRTTGIPPEEIDFVSAHATSTPLGDLTELRSIKEVFGDHAYRLKINAPKSMLGHTCWSAPAVEMVAAILQMNNGTLHPSINIDKIDPEVDLDVCAGRQVKHSIRTFVKNSFGFGGINCCSLVRRYEG